MKFNQLTNLKSNQSKKRKGRGIAAGSGKTAGRGTKGQNSRSGGGVRTYFEGGQTPLIQRLPKLPGFTSHRPETLTIYSGQLDSIKTNSKVIDNYVLVQAGLIEDAYRNVKLIRRGGEIKQAHQLQLQGASKQAQKDLIAAGGSFKKIPRPKRPASEKKRARREKRDSVDDKSRESTKN